MILDVKKFLEYLYNKQLKKWLIFSIVISIVLVTYALMLPNQYTSRAVVIPVNQDLDNTAANSTLSSLRGLGFGNFGLNVSGEVLDKDKTLRTIKSISFVEYFLNDEILKGFYAAKSYNKYSKEIIINEKIFDVENNDWVRKVPPLLTPRPSAQEFYRLYVPQLMVSEDRRTGLISISYEHISPEFSKYLVEHVVNSLNEYMSIEAKNEAKRFIEYLKVEIQGNNIKEIDAVFNVLLQQNTQKMMYAEAKPDFALKYVSKPVVPLFKSGPSRAIICIFGFIFFQILFLLYGFYAFKRK